MSVMVQRVQCCQYASVAQRGLPAPLADWLRAHGIDPESMFTPGNISACDQSRQINYDAHTNEQGFVTRSDDGHALVTPRVVQLEAAPLPMPLAEQEQA